MTFPSDLRAIARALGGEAVGGQVLAPGPGHGPRDRSMSVKISATAPLGFMAHSHSGDDFRVVRDHIADKLGIPSDAWKRDRPLDVKRPAPTLDLHAEGDRAAKIATALALWAAGTDPRATPAEVYLNSRSLVLDADVALEVLRWHRGTSAMLALFRNIETDAPQAVSRTFITHEGVRITRRFFGPTKGAAIKLDADEEVLAGFHVAEGIETGMAARQLGLRPTWALGSCGAIASFPVLAGIECLTLLAEDDDASRRAVDACAARWHAAGRTVIINEPKMGSDLNDAIRRRA